MHVKTTATMIAVVLLKDSCGNVKKTTRGGGVSGVFVEVIPALVCVPLLAAVEVDVWYR